ncbi:MAG TPA: helicase-related protein [Rhizomicrobium sp.]|nr:helicase-related protein [Rhizomicrobium sp.]
MIQRSAPAPKVSAVLGPTNTGKTFFAIERMLAHRSGMIGLPLRLLAREVYDRVVRLKGANDVALITGEEKIVPKAARFYVCTVEAMPLEIEVACLVVDEIQLAADPERGHIFTDRLLHARGQEETLFLGAESMRGAIQRFIPKAWFITRPRFSDLAYTGAKKLTRLPRRSAVVGFSAEDVYGIAEIVRRQRGGAAVVLGALSPRTRNAQVALYQSGEVDFLVATDAIGMGLNMDVDHVAFAGAEKFDGRGFRPLTAAEMGQIAGRAGRYMNDGTFGVTGEGAPFDEDMVNRIESHRYDAIKVLQWRNAKLEFQSLPALLESLDAPPPERGLARARPASDAIALHHLAREAEVLALATSRDRVRRLWDVCQLPDFRKLSVDDHARMVRTLFLFLMSQQGRIPDDWMARQIARLDVAEGDVATLSGRLAQIRTFTYAAHRPGWTSDGSHWQGETRAVEDRLSDALHERLTQRFIDRRASILMKHLRDDEIADVKLEEDGGVLIGGELIGRLDGFRFTPDPRGEKDGNGLVHTRMLRTAAMRGLEAEFVARARALAAAPDTALALSEHGKFWWDGAIVGHLIAGPTPLAPKVNLVADELLKGPSRASVEARLESWLAAHMEKRLEPLLALARAAETRAGSEMALPAYARGVAHQLAENFGALDRQELALPEKLGPLLRALKPFGVWFGRRTIYLPRLLRPDAAGLLALLWGIWGKVPHLTGPPAPGLTSFAHDGEPRAFLHAAGFHLAGERAIRFDMLERLEEELDKAARNGAGAASLLPKLVSLLGASNEEARLVLAALGWRQIGVKDADPVWRKASEKRRQPERQKPPPEHSPFAGLKELIAK